MGERLSWDEMKQRFDGEWIEIVDYDWPDDRPYPLAGVVRAHSRTRKDFHQCVKQLPHVPDSAWLFVGKSPASAGSVFSPSWVRISPC